MVTATKTVSFAGLFGATPSVALATLALAISKEGKAYAGTECRSMMGAPPGFACTAFSSASFLPGFDYRLSWPLSPLPRTIRRGVSTFMHCRRQLSTWGTPAVYAGVAIAAGLTFPRMEGRVFPALGWAREQARTRAPQN